jgi:hypothetical protein
MKKKFLLAAAAMFTAGAVFAGTQNDAGCGLGSILFTEADPIQQILAATTNGTSGNQTFGITTGTLNCKNSLIKAQSDQEKFVRTNFRDLNREIAAGKGEYVTSLATILGCSETASFVRFAQNRYELLFPVNAEPVVMLQTLKAELIKDASLRTSCTLL